MTGDDFRGRRTATFGKTRLGKSNVVKLLVEGDDPGERGRQLVFDLNGEYANDNPQDGNTSLRAKYQNRCPVYALVKRPSTDSKPLKLSFYEQPDCL